MVFRSVNCVYQHYAGVEVWLKDGTYHRRFYPAVVDEHNQYWWNNGTITQSLVDGELHKYLTPKLLRKKS